MERPSSSVYPMQRLTAVVASDSIQTPWIVPSLHPARCDKQFPCTSLPLSGSFSPRSPLFAVSGHLIYYSSEVKQYSTDVMIALLLFWITVYIQSKELLTRRVVLLLGLSGGIAIWFSHPSIFVLAGGALSLTYSGVGRREWGSFRRFCPAYLIWAISFMILYAFSLRILINQEGLLGYWAGGFMPFPPVSKSDIKWYWDTFIHLFSEPVVMRFPGIAALAFLVGCGSLFMKRRDKFYLFFSPIIAALLASSMHKYPFNGRLILFLVPSLFIFMAEGIAKIMVSTRTTSKMLGIALIALLFADPMMNAAGRIVKPYTREEIRAVLDYVARQQKQEDLFYLYHYSIHAFRYYSDRYSFKSSHIRFGISSLRDWNQYVKDLNSLRGNKRVWILFSHVLPPTWKGIGVDEEKFFIYHLDNIGKKLDSFKSEGAAAYLYDLSEKKAKLPFR